MLTDALLTFGMLKLTSRMMDEGTQLAPDYSRVGIEVKGDKTRGWGGVDALSAPKVRPKTRRCRGGKERVLRGEERGMAENRKCLAQIHGVFGRK